MDTRTKKRLYTLFGMVVSAVLVWMLFRDINFGELTLALKQANYWWLIPNILLIVLTMYQRAYRWKFMIEPIKPVPFPKLLAATCIGFMANNVLPLRLGEFVRAYSLSSQDREITKSASLATIFGERMVFDLAGLLLIFGVVLFVASDLAIPDEIIAGLKLSTVIALVGIVFMLILALRPERVGSLLAKYLFFVPDRGKDVIKSTVMKFSRGLTFLSDRRAVVSVSVQTLLIWVLMGVSNVFVLMAFDFGLPLDASFVVLVVVSISILIPSTPGFLGVYHYAVVLSLGLYGIEQEAALSCALVLHAAQYIVVTLMGFYFLKKAHLSLKKLEQAAEQDDA